MNRSLEVLPDWPDWKREIAQRLNDTGASMKEISLRAGLGETWVRDALKRDKEPTHRNLMKVKEVLGLAKSIQAKPIRVGNLPVVGRAQAGAFLDVSIISQDEEFETIPVAQLPRYAHARQYALLVVGDSMNKLFDDGSYVTCVDWDDSGLVLRPGMCLHVERHQGSLVEVTLKYYDIDGGVEMLFPKSTNIAHRPIRLEAEEDGHVFVKGLVVGVWKPIIF